MTAKKRTLLLAGTLALALGLSAAAHADPTAPEPAPQTGLTAQQREDLMSRLENLGATTPAGEQETATAQATAANGWRTHDFKETASLETDNGLGALAELDGDKLLINQYGTLTRLDGEQNVVWRRTASTLWPEWKLTYLRPWSRGIPAFQVKVGTYATSSVGDWTDRGYAVGDLTGDGVDDVAFISYVGDTPSSPVVLPESKSGAAGIVDVLDGATGTTLWSKRYMNARMVLIQDGTLVVADMPIGNRLSEPTSLAKAYAYTFTRSGDTLTETPKWTVDTGSHTAYWNVLEPAGDGKVALGWSENPSKRLGGHLMALDTASGVKAWDVATPNLVRTLGLDGRRGVLVGTEQDTYGSDSVGYKLVTYTLAGGARTELSTRVNALPMAMDIADVTGGRGPEYLVTEGLPDPIGYIAASQVRATDGGAQLWTYTVKRSPDWGKDGPLMFGLTTSGGDVIVNWMDDTRIEQVGTRTREQAAGMAVLRGRDGEPRWEHRGGPHASPLYALPGDGRVATVSYDQTYREYGLRDGDEDVKTPLFGDFSQLATYDVNGDGVKDLIVGGEAHGVLAFDGTRLGAQARPLWRATAPGAIHRLALANVSGSSRPELVVAATGAVMVIDPRDGDVDEEFGGGHGDVWTFAVGELSGDAKHAEIVVPTDGVRAYDGDGDRLWTYGEDETLAWSSVAIADRQVYAMYTTRADAQGATPQRGSVAVTARGRTAWKAPASIVDREAIGLWNGVYADPAIPFADGHAVAFAIGSDSVDTAYEVRDGRTGELVTAVGPTSGAAMHRQFLVTPAGLTQVRQIMFATVGPDKVPHGGFLIPNPFGAALATGPDGEPLIVSGNEGYLATWDTSVLTADKSYVTAKGDSTGGLENWTVIVDDLDGDGTQEIIGLDLDAVMYDRIQDRTGGGYWSVSPARTGVGIFTIVKL
ncbi:hypothetical protein Afil01_05560 [Actinorhabdospora filicis]|uniref:VCBS repeat protein n=1 Tax=Actinorhabdospora filicis TaxID=1785913 RepID=A0A9W6SEI8_9ACTN|nr:hypothetical protein [Actinorhabdospora filicis]GLZ75749.1 hypothetical protein Afil01_05560 [Actinorhabdospora filicis]